MMPEEDYCDDDYYGIRLFKHLSTNARSYGGTTLSSDHKIDITTFELEWCKVKGKTKHTTNSRNKANIANVVNNQECRAKYQQQLDTRLGQMNQDNTPNETWHWLSESKFKDESNKDIPPLEGTPRALRPVSKDEVRKSFNQLKNNKVSGEDKIQSELLKYAPPIVDETNANNINNAFETHETLDINSGVLIAIQKPGKAKGPLNNPSSITLLNTTRKSLSLITLDIIRPAVEQYFAHSQSVFRPDRSTSGVIWTHKLMASGKNKYRRHHYQNNRNRKSTAFDTIDREVLLKILEEDELRLIPFLLSNTQINTRINKADIQVPFTSNVGTPQGDGLSPLAQDRNEWRTFTRRITEFAEATDSDEPEANSG
ncbi:retrovirus-related Pol polyprotein LINE-1 [Elysia marginata]|uniref:Retrovirus-related Pol polyprotein LINE-1 n=1 Tax=Elysia marginata TaxID=1093978 RepID=A0AAV4JTQ3_9GAST|nr:retrovirus-related Pol polyprotein LINE-1 [Elysia marginata]